VSALLAAFDLSVVVRFDLDVARIVMLLLAYRLITGRR
jgi:hypothetical protein